MLYFTSTLNLAILNQKKNLNQVSLTYKKIKTAYTGADIGDLIIAVVLKDVECMMFSPSHTDDDVCKPTPTTESPVLSSMIDKISVKPLSSIKH